VTFAELAQVIGREAALKLAHYAGGSLEYLPKPPGPDTVAKVLELAQAGLTSAHIAARVDRTARRVQQILAEAKSS